MVVAKWYVRRTSGAPKALAVALSFCRLLGLGCPKQAFAKIATPRIQAWLLQEVISCTFLNEYIAFPKVSFISKFSVLSEFIGHLPTAADFNVSTFNPT
ncbi:hypothetical protein BMR09_10735 [Methylococcaceae bacterium CS3]|nr:hypothetical protein BMR09_10735 [Methylococcaceae bacterium CS3]